MGPQDDEFGEAKALFLTSEWRISATSDRMGYRLEGPVIKHLYGHNIVSDGTVNGSIQVPGNGQPIVLMPDRNTTGGYPKIATVISADLGRFGQTPAGRGFRFTAVTMAEAQAEYRVMVALVAGRCPSASTLPRTSPSTSRRCTAPMSPAARSMPSMREPGKLSGIHPLQRTHPHDYRSQQRSRRESFGVLADGQRRRA